MGAWDIAPWNNDGAADWYAEMFEATKLDELVVKTLKLDPGENYEEIRAAAAMMVMLGRTYVWPVEKLDGNLSIAASALEKLLSVPELAESEECVSAIRDEIQELRSRIKGSDIASSEAQEQRKWWQFWK